MYLYKHAMSIYREVMEKSFPDYYDYYEGICKGNMTKQGETMQVNVH